jgi:hypothetical protein
MTFWEGSAGVGREGEGSIRSPKIPLLLRVGHPRCSPFSLFCLLRELEEMGCLGTSRLCRVVSG